MNAKLTSIMGLLLCPTMAAGQSIPTASVFPEGSADTALKPVRCPACYILPALTPVKLLIEDHLSSGMSKIGDHFAIRLAASIDLGGGVVIPAGTEGFGEVIHAAKSGFGGRAGELILVARHLEYHGVQIPLRSLTYAPELGKNREGTAIGVAIAGGLIGSVAAMFITGGEVDIPAGTTVYAKTASVVDLAGASNENQ